MSELGARQWQDLIQSRRAEGAAKNHVQNVLRERKQDGLKKPDGQNFQQYIEMRRGLSGSDGKSRSKGHPSGDGQKKGNEQNRGRSFLRPTELTTATKEKVVAANENKTAKQSAAAKPTNTRQGRIANGYQAAKDHFRKVSEKVNEGFKSKSDGKRASHLPQSNVGQAAQHSVKQRAADTGAQAKQQAKVQQKAPPPVMKKGK